MRKMQRSQQRLSGAQGMDDGVDALDVVITASNTCSLPLASMYKCWKLEEIQLVKNNYMHFRLSINQTWFEMCAWPWEKRQPIWYQPTRPHLFWAFSKSDTCPCLLWHPYSNTAKSASWWKLHKSLASRFCALLRTVSEFVETANKTARSYLPVALVVHFNMDL